MKIAIIIPTYNESGNIKPLVEKIFEMGIDGLEIIAVDDNSPDGTGKIIKGLRDFESRIHLIERLEKMGLGTAYLDGFRYALQNGAEYIFEMDADFSHEPKMIPVFLEALKNHDLVIGSRYIQGIGIVNWPLRRLALSYFANLYARVVTGIGIKDLTSGFKGYRRQIIEKIDLDKIRSNGYSFQIEMKFRAKKAGFTSCEIPIIFVDRHSGTSKISKNIILEALIIVWKLRFEGILKRAKK
jgi:dolichol-phosphate mannosyltransferase